MEMGFDEKEVVDALRVNNNQQDAAVGVLAVKITHFINYFNRLQNAKSLIVKTSMECSSTVMN